MTYGRGSFSHSTSRLSAVGWTHDDFVAGGTGKTGGRVVTRLQDRGVAVRAGSRKTGFDWARPESWAPAIGDADRAYLTYYPDVAVPSAVEDLSAFGKVAADLGMQRIVLLSGRGEPEAV